MITIREFVKTGGSAINDDQLTSMMRERMEVEPLHQRAAWIREVELLLDAFGTKPQLEAATRVREVLKRLAPENPNGR